MYKNVANKLYVYSLRHNPLVRLEDQLRAHCLGQRHFYNMRQRDTAQRSVYIKGFPKRTAVDEAEIRAIFQQFGSIHKVVLDEKVYAYYNY